MIKDYSKVVKEIRRNLTVYLLEHKLKSLVLGISGGMDSALVAVLAKPVCDDLGVKLIGRCITIESNKYDEIDRADLIGKYFCTDYKRFNFDAIHGSIKYMDALDENIVDIDRSDPKFNKIKFGNMKARARMIYLYNLAYKTKGMVLGTENLTERNLSFFTIGADEISDFESIEGLWKTEVYNTAEWLCANELMDNDMRALYACIVCTATDGLGITNSDLDQILPEWTGSSRGGYKVVDDIFINYFESIEKLNLTTDEIEKNNLINKINELEKTSVIQRYNRYSYKRNRPFVIKRENFL